MIAQNIHVLNRESEMTIIILHIILILENHQGLEFSLVTSRVEESSLTKTLGWGSWPISDWLCTPISRIQKVRLILSTIGGRRAQVPGFF